MLFHRFNAKDSIRNKDLKGHLNFYLEITMFFNKLFEVRQLMSQVVTWKLNCVDFIICSQEGQQFEGYCVNFMVEEHNILFTIICAFQFWIVWLLFWFVWKAWMHVDTHFLSKNFIVLVDIFLLIDQGFELILECVYEIVCFVQLLLSVLCIFPEGTGFEDGDNFCKNKRSSTFLFFLFGRHESNKVINFLSSW